MKILASAVLVTVLFLAPAAMAGSCGGAAHTHSPKEMANHYFDKMDLNGDKVAYRAVRLPKYARFDKKKAILE